MLMKNMIGSVAGILGFSAAMAELLPGQTRYRFVSEREVTHRGPRPKRVTITRVEDTHWARSKYTPHQGQRERARRLKRLGK